MKLSKDEVAFATEVVRKLIISNMKADLHAEPLYPKVARAELTELILIGEDLMNDAGWDATDNPCEFKVGNIWKGRKRFVQR